MKKLIKKIVKVLGILLIVFVYLFSRFLLNEKENVELIKCVDGDTAHFDIHGVDETVRFLAIDTPEIKHGNTEAEEYGEEAANYVCNALKDASNITLEFEKGSYRDKYDRVLAWVFVDDELLQEQLISQGYAEVKYIYDDYKYVNKLKVIQEIAKLNKKGIWK